MRFKLLIPITALILLAVAAFLPSEQVSAACGVVLAGSFNSTDPNQTSPVFTVLAGDIVTATSVDSLGTATNMGAEITINSLIFGGGQTGTGSVTVTATALGSGTASVFFYNQGGSGGVLSWTITISGPNCVNVTTTPQPGATIWDDRENPDPWATVVLYCRGGGIVAYDVDLESKGKVLFVVTPADIAEVGISDVNTLLGSGQGLRGLASLYRLTDGKFELIAPELDPGKQYIFIWEGCA